MQCTPCIVSFVTAPKYFVILYDNVAQVEVVVDKSRVTTENVANLQFQFIRYNSIELINL